MISDPTSELNDGGGTFAITALGHAPIGRDLELYTIVINLFGAPAVHVGAKLISQSQWQRADAKRLFFVLVLQSEHRLSRDQLGKLLWPKLDKISARTKLTNSLYSLRRAMSAAANRVVASAASVQLVWDAHVSCDIEQFERHLDTAACCSDPVEKRLELEAALALYRGDLLEGFESEPWIDQDRALLKVRRLQALDTLVALHRDHRRVAEAIDMQRIRVSADPLHQDSHAILLNLLLEANHIELASAHYKVCRDVIASELGQAPNLSIQAIYAKIRARIAAETGSSSASVVATKTDPQSNAAVHSAPPAALTLSIEAAHDNDAYDEVVSQLIGRQHDVSALLTLLREPGDSARFVTVTGFGGVGKTSLVRQLMAEWSRNGTSRADLASDRSERPSPVRFVDLSEKLTIELAAEQIEHALGLPVSILASDGATAGDGHELIHGLFVVDNFEHLVDHAEVLSRLSQRCPSLVVLVTSRVPLRLSDETVYQLLPLEVATDAVQLFIRRARQHNPKLLLDAQSMADIAKICSALDGLPLAIELAAARTRLLNPRELLSRLKKDLSLLRAKPDANEGTAHTSLSAILHWTIGLLSAPERELLLLLRVFQGGFTLSSVEEMFAERGGETIDLFEALLDHQLIVPMQRDARDGGQKSRWMLLETVRQFVTQLAMEGETKHAAQHVHAEYFVHHMLQLTEPDADADAARLFFAHESDNLLAALEARFALTQIGSVTAVMRAIPELMKLGRWSAIDHWIDRLTQKSENLLTPEQQVMLDTLSVKLYSGVNHPEKFLAAAERLTTSLQSGALLTAATLAAARMLCLGSVYRDGDVSGAVAQCAQLKLLGELQAIGGSDRVELLVTEMLLADYSGDVQVARSRAREISGANGMADVNRVFVEMSDLSYRGQIEESLALATTLEENVFAKSDMESTFYRIIHHANIALEAGLVERAVKAVAPLTEFGDADSQTMYPPLILADDASVRCGLLCQRGPSRDLNDTLQELLTVVGQERQFHHYGHVFIWGLRAALVTQSAETLARVLAAIVDYRPYPSFVTASRLSEALGCVAVELQLANCARDCFVISEETRDRANGTLSAVERAERVRLNIPIQTVGDKGNFKATPTERFSGRPFWEIIERTVVTMRDKARDVANREVSLSALGAGRSALS